MFLKAWDEKTTPLIQIIEDNTTAYTKAANQQERDHINETIKQADTNLNDLYAQLEEAYSLIFPNRVMQEPQPVQPVQVAPAAQPAGEAPAQYEGFAPFERAPATDPIIFRADDSAVESAVAVAAPAVDPKEQYVLDMARKDQLINQLSDIPARYARTTKDDPEYDVIAADRLKWTTELNEVEQRLQAYNDAQPQAEDTPVSGDEQAEQTAQPEERRKNGGGRKRGMYLLLAIILVALTFGAIYLLNNVQAAGPPDDPVAVTAPLDQYLETLDIEQPAYYTADSLKTEYTDYTQWAQDVGITELFSQSDHESIRDYFFAPYIQGKDADTIAQNTAKFFWAADLYSDMTADPDSYDFLQQSDSNIVQAIYSDISQSDNYGLAIATLVQQYDAVRTVVDANQ